MCASPTSDLEGFITFLLRVFVIFLMMCNQMSWKRCQGSCFNVKKNIELLLFGSNLGSPYQLV